ncbi:ATP-dependent helicase/deoxyribonuclease subunit B [Pseudobythopirellula maris]|uniref:ATP-dependent helicase/deoxyribonuclease subunit B n=1 Tax=Pseudobythopirellula maris TaxID=2527991 RepID=A0A5C5ZTY9_9BACT|nr:PD-(D/E)XK nuclease family protein [Pseudobythopirellula maris]TWT90555.1 ATP-dependent helicase/deoxyribonuclease subunit B [Pseudobythopirellula maris]
MPLAPSPQTVTLVHGAPACRTKWLLDRYRDSLGERGQPMAASLGSFAGVSPADGPQTMGGSPPAWLWLGPNHRATESVRSCLLEGEGSTALLEPGVRTPRRLADALASLTDSRHKPLGAAERQALVTDLLRRRALAGRLGPLGAVGVTRGTVDLVDRAIVEARSQCLSGKAASAYLRRSHGAVGAAIADVYRDYTGELAEHQLHDEAGRMALATELIAAGPSLSESNGAHWRLVVVDGFLDYSPLELRLLRAIRSRAETMLVSVAGADRLGQSAWVERRLTDELGPVERVDLAAPARHPAGLRKARAWLFDDPRSLPPPEELGPAAAESIEVVAARSPREECRAIARRIKRLLLDGAAPQEVVVAARRLPDGGQLLAEALADHGVPCSVEPPRRLGEAPLAAAVRTLLRLRTRDWPFDTLLSAVGEAGFVALGSLGATAPRGRTAAERLVRSLQLPERRKSLMTQAASLVSRSEESEGPPTDLQRQAIDGLPVLERLAVAVDAFAERATPLDWFDTVQGVFESLGWSSESRIDQAAWRAFEDALAALERLARWRDVAATTVSCAELLGWLEDWSERLTLSLPAEEEGRVRIATAATAATLPCRWLFLCGLSEESFAASRGASMEEDPAADEANATPQDAETQLFYELASRPSEWLVLSYPALDHAAQPLPPSPFVTELERLFPAGALRRDDQTAVFRAIRPDEPPLGESDFRLHAVHDALAGDASTLASAASRGGALVEALAMVAERQTGDTFGAAEGLFGDEAARLALAERYGPEHLWSPSQLELYATCPYKFFARQLLGLEPVEGLQFDVDYRRRGSIVHDAMAAFHDRLGLIEDARGGHSRVEAERFLDALVGALREKLAATGLPPLEAALAEIETRQAERWAQGYHGQLADYEKHGTTLDEPLTPQRFEARFGPSRRGGEGEEEDPHSVDEPFAFDLGDERLLVTGRIDRIDIGMLDGERVFTVIDYKTGASVTSKLDDMESGRQLQLVLYALAAESLGLAGEGAKPLLTGYWSVQKKGFVAPKGLSAHNVTEGEHGFTLAPNQVWERLVETIRRRIKEIVVGVRGGVFPMLNPDEHCGARCEFRTVCRVGQARSLGKSLTTENGED